MLYLLDGAIIPTEGIYIFYRLDQEQFIQALRDAMKAGELRCHILDKDLCGTIGKMSGVMLLPPMGREQQKVEMQNGDQLIVVSLAPSVDLKAPTIHMRTTRLTHYNDNPEGIAALIDEQSRRGLTPDYLDELGIYLSKKIGNEMFPIRRDAEEKDE